MFYKYFVCIYIVSILKIVFESLLIMLNEEETFLWYFNVYMKFYVLIL